MSVQIRPCEPRDLPVVVELMRQLSEVAEAASDFDLDLVRAIHEDMAHYPAIYLNLVAEDAGGVVGFISLIFYKTFFHRGGTALINELIVDRARRGGGVGAALIEAAIREARARGMDEIEVGTERENAAAQRFYHKHGFDEEYVLLGTEFA
jgi:GNAT superfamily N-acetyltransferase